MRIHFLDSVFQQIVMINVWKQQDQQWDQQDCQPDIGAGNKTNHNGGGHQGKQHCDDQMDQPFMLKKTDLCQMVFDGLVQSVSSGGA